MRLLTLPTFESLTQASKLRSLSLCAVRDITSSLVQLMPATMATIMAIVCRVSLWMRCVSGFGCQKLIVADVVTASSDYRASHTPLTLIGTDSVTLVCWAPRALFITRFWSTMQITLQTIFKPCVNIISITCEKSCKKTNHHLLVVFLSYS